MISVLYRIIDGVLLAVIKRDPPIWKFEGGVIGRGEYQSEKRLPGGVQFSQFLIRFPKQILVAYSPATCERWAIVVELIDNMRSFFSGNGFQHLSLIHI